MPRFTKDGHVVSGYSQVAYDKVALYGGPGGKGWPFSDDSVVANVQMPDGSWKVATLWLEGGPPIEMGPGANFLCGGDNRWIGSNPGQGMFGTLTTKTGNELALAAGHDGTLAYVPNYAVGYGLTLNAPDGSEVSVPDAAVQDVQVLGPRQAIWYEGAGKVRVLNVQQPKFALTPEKVRLAVHGGEVWLLYWSPQTSTVVLHVDGETTGYVLTAPGQLAYNRDMVATPDGRLLVCWSRSQGEAPADVGVEEIDTTRPRTALVPGVAQPVFVFMHKVLVRPFFAQGSGVPDLFTEGTYTEQPTLPVPMPANRLLLAHDGQSDWTIPHGLRDYDVPMIELYRLKAETLKQSVDRWERQAQDMLAQWPDACGVIPMFYCQGGTPGGDPPELWTVGEVLDGLDHLTDIVNISPRITLIAPFAYHRANGIDAHPELETAFRNLLAAEQTAGQATLPPVTKPIDPPKPTPGGFRPPSTFTLGGHMSQEKGGIIGPGGKFGRMGPQGTSPFGGGDYATWRGMIFDGVNSDGDYEFTLTEVSPGRGTCVDTATGCYAGYDMTKYGGDLHKVSYGKPADPGGYETLFMFGPMFDSHIKMLAVQYGPDAEQVGFGAALFTWVKK